MDDLRRHVDKFYGKYAGEVTGNEDDDHQGRILVKVPAIFGADLEVRARPCLPFGHFYVPAVGTRVWVEFEAGDRRYPIWVGSWYPAGEAPATAQRTPPDSRVIETPSGHTIELHDGAGAEKIVIQHSGGSSLTLAKDGSVVVTDGVATLELKSGKVTVSGAAISLDSASVAAGTGAAEPTILGATFATMWMTFLTAYAAHVHVAPGKPPDPDPLPTLPTFALLPGKGLTTALVVK